MDAADEAEDNAHLQHFPPFVPTSSVSVQFQSETELPTEGVPRCVMCRVIQARVVLSPCEHSYCVPCIQDVYDAAEYASADKHFLCPKCEQTVQEFRRLDAMDMNLPAETMQPKRRNSTATILSTITGNLQDEQEQSKSFWNRLTGWAMPKKQLKRAQTAPTEMHQPAQIQVSADHQSNIHPVPAHTNQPKNRGLHGRSFSVHCIYQISADTEPQSPPAQVDSGIASPREVEPTHLTMILPPPPTHATWAALQSNEHTFHGVRQGSRTTRPVSYPVTLPRRQTDSAVIPSARDLVFEL